MEDPKTLLCSLKFLCARSKVYWKFMDNLDTCPALNSLKDVWFPQTADSYVRQNTA